MARNARQPPNPFEAYHRARLASTVARIAAVGVPTALAVAGMFVLGSLTTAQAVESPMVAISQPAVTPTVEPTALPAPGPVAASATIPAPTAALALGDRIDITATGYQAELDQCKWVRMDLGIAAPIVGAHNRCGGTLVLTMHLGGVVELHGQGLDGKYVVTDARDAHSGDDAFTATDGMNAQVILQTCYPGTGGRERLVGLEPAD